MSRPANTEPPIPAPDTPDELHAFLREHLGVECARTPILKGSTAPFDYLQHAFFEPPRSTPAASRDCVVWANRGGGKTFLGAVATLLDLVYKPGVNIRILAGSLDQSQYMMGHLRALFARPPFNELAEGRITDKRIRLANGSVCEIMAQSHTSVRGARPQILRCDEVDLFDDDIWSAAQLVTRSEDCGPVYVRGRIEALSTMHVPHGLMSRIVERTREVYPQGLFRWGVVDVLENCPPERPCSACPLEPECNGRAKRPPHQRGGHMRIDDAITQKSRVSLPVWQTEMLCLRPKRDGLVYPAFDPNLHISDLEPRTKPGATPWRCGMDFGFRAPTVVLWGWLDFAGALRIAHERVVAGTRLDEHARAIANAEWGPPEWIAIDPAGHQVNSHTGITDAQALGKAGVPVRSRVAGVEEGINLVRDRMAPAFRGAPPRLFIHPRCRELIKALETYRYADDVRNPSPVKDGPDHACDALRYLVTALDKPGNTKVRRYDT